jgi:hypothetical protein
MTFERLRPHCRTGFMMLNSSGSGWIMFTDSFWYPGRKQAASGSTQEKVSLPGVQALFRSHRRAPGRLGSTSKH